MLPADTFQILCVTHPGQVIDNLLVSRNLDAVPVHDQTLLTLPSANEGRVYAVMTRTPSQSTSKAHEGIDRQKVACPPVGISDNTL